MVVQQMACLITRNLLLMMLRKNKTTSLLVYLEIISATQIFLKGVENMKNAFLHFLIFFQIFVIYLHLNELNFLLKKFSSKKLSVNIQSMNRLIPLPIHGEF